MSQAAVTGKDISFESYGEYASDNYGAHSLCFTIGDKDFYFSYKTLVAVRGNGRLVCIENLWGPTTGKHLNRIQPDHSKRLHADDFHAAVQEIMSE